MYSKLVLSQIVQDEMFINYVVATINLSKVLFFALWFNDSWQVYQVLLLPVEGQSDVLNFLQFLFEVNVECTVESGTCLERRLLVQFNFEEWSFFFDDIHVYIKNC